MRQTLRHKAASIVSSRRILRVLIASALFLSLIPLASRADDENSSSRRDAAKAQFDRAEKARETLEARPEKSRTLKDYTALVVEYQRISLTSPHGVEVPASLNEVAELFRTMGDLFDSKYYQRSIDAFQFLLKEYPTSKYREDALLAIAQIQQDDLHDAALAQKTYQQFLAQHPRSSHAAEVRADLDNINKQNAASAAASSPAAKVSPQPAAAKEHPERATAKTIAADKTPPATDTREGVPSDDDSDSDSSGPRVSRI